MNPPFWTNRYPQGTPEGDEEYDFFIALVRGPNVWCSTHSLSVETGLPPDRIEQIIDKYIRLGMIFQSDNHDDRWAYWERVPDRVTKPPKSLLEKDHEDRMSRFDDPCSDGLYERC